MKSGVVFATKPLVATGCSPAPLTLSGPGTTIFWSDGSESTYDTDISTDSTSGAFGLKAVITSGTLGGVHFTAVPAILTQAGFCLLGGVRSLFGFGVAMAINAAPARAARHSFDRRRLRGRR